MTLHVVVGVKVDVMLHLQCLSRSTEPRGMKSSISSSSTTNGVEEDTILCASCISKSDVIWQFLLIFTQYQ
jgi:hypothetical protein